MLKTVNIDKWGKYFSIQLECEKLTIFLQILIIIFNSSSFHDFDWLKDDFDKFDFIEVNNLSRSFYSFNYFCFLFLSFDFFLST
jgi:hypothetical protein